MNEDRCSCSPRQAAEVLEEITARALRGDEQANRLIATALEHALHRGGLLPLRGSGRA